MNINIKPTPATILLAFISCLIPFSADIGLPLLHGHTVTMIENSQAILLLLGAVLTFSYMKPFQLTEGSRKFWLWSVLWWVVLLGRSTSWGRDYFPELPKAVFRSISVILIASLVLSYLLSSQLRKAIAVRFKTWSIPLWTCMLVVTTFLLADTVEHHRLLSPIFLHDLNYQDLIEELFETPFILGLLLISLDFMKQDMQCENSQNGLLPGLNTTVS
ncbi:hypothetical protein MUU47_20095 [Scandinavium sp. H11S7]|uniref:Nitric oxide reductase n=1 Tax=Scandinavium hiltneri TaxID=2926519 RepID=A0ABT2E679_9ENTR|nr:hypothetical protein [Scandinavium hiltneri]MCS2163390.1 hypothetical protein [Scandinavium hiltneri]